MGKDRPGLQEWLALPLDEMAARVRAQHLSVKVAVDGTTRHYLLRHPNETGAITDFSAYARSSMDTLLNLLDLLFSHGFETVLVLNVWSPDVERRQEHVRNAALGTRELVIGSAARDYYKRWNVRVGFYGNYDISPIYDNVRGILEEVRTILEQATAGGSRLLLWGYCAGSPLEELIARTVSLYRDLGRLPTEEDLRLACFPHGPEHLDIAIGGGWLRFGNADVIPILNHGFTDLYSLSHLALDLTGNEVRRILYDRLFLRHAASPTDTTRYTTDVLASLSAYYTEHRECVLGLGHLVGPGLWYPDHDHRPIES